MERETAGVLMGAAPQWAVTEDAETPPYRILPHRGGFQGFFRAAEQNLDTAEKLAKDSMLYMVCPTPSLSLSLIFKKKVQKDGSECK